MAALHSNPNELPPIVRYQPLVVVLVAVVAGMIVDRFVPLPARATWSVAVGAWIAWAVLHRVGRYELLAAVMLLVCIAATGAVWHHAQWYEFSASDIGRFARAAPQPVCVEVIARQEPRRTPAPPFDPLRAMPTSDRDRLTVDVVALRDGRRWRPAAGRAQLLVEGHVLGVHAGDRLRVFAQLSATRPAGNPGEFDFARYSRADRQLGLLRANYPDCLNRLQAGPWYSPVRLLGKLRAQGDQMLRTRLHPSRRPLASAILLGERNLLSADETETFMTTGSVHLLVVSGMHVALLALVLLAAMRLGMLPRRVAWLTVLGLVVLYGLMTGARPPVVRAVVLIAILAVGKLVGRRAWSFNALAAAALVVLALNPADLFRTGAQLSFLAVAVLMVVGRRWSSESDDPLRRLIAETRPWPQRVMAWCGHSYWRLTLASLAVWLVCLPLVMAQFHLCTPVTILAGPLLWFPMAVALLAGFGVLLCEWILPPVATICGAVCDGACSLLRTGATWASDLPGGYVWVTGPEIWWVVGFYAGLGWLVAFPRWRPKPRWMVGLLAAWTLVGLAPGILWSQEESVQATFISVGHGSSVLVEMPDGRALLYDAGALASPRSAARAIAAVLWSRGRTHLDAVVVSHADVDHYNALPDLLERFSVDTVLVSPMMFERPSGALDELQARLSDANVPVREIYAGDRLAVGADVRLDILHPPRTGVLGSDNANSVVLLVEYRGRRMLLPGDLESPGLDDVLAEQPIDCDVLLAPHHGSRRSDPPGFAAWSTPDWLIVSGGDPRDAESVTTAYMAVGARVLHTAQHGAVTVSLRAAGVDVRAWLE